MQPPPPLPFFLFRTEEPATVGTCARDRCALQQLTLIVHVMHSYLLHAHNALSQFESVWATFQSVLHDWCNKGRGMHYPDCLMLHIKEPLLLIEKSSQSGGSGFPFLLCEWSFTICLTPYSRK